MSKILKKRMNKPGLSPGSLVHVGEQNVETVTITLIDYDAQKIVEKKGASLKECMISLNTPTLTWINVCGIHDSTTIETIGRHFGLHPLILEDIMNSEQQSKLDNYKDTIYIVARQLIYNNEKQCVEDEQVSIILGKNFIISFLESSNNVFNPIYNRLKNPKGRMRQRGSDYLCYALLDCLVDNYFLILEKVDDHLENLEDELFHRSNDDTLKKMHHAKRELVLLRKSVWPMREVISNFRRIESPLVQNATKLYIQDVYDHTIQAIDTIESFRDITSGMLDIYLSNLSQRMNEIMKVLTIVATIFVPLTFLASIYGMNFKHMPELEWEWGYYFTLGLMAIMVIGMLYFFKRKKWL
ncbi:MAG: magnesium/cobalt transporter CorA [Parachlamydiaceae bacterium]|nr:magnesium/cobalt transporter CorA [Parachlamydiaceae bacterium]